MLGLYSLLALNVRDCAFPSLAAGSNKNPEGPLYSFPTCLFAAIVCCSGQTATGGMQEGCCCQTTGVLFLNVLACLNVRGLVSFIYG